MTIFQLILVVGFLVVLYFVVRKKKSNQPTTTAAPATTAAPTTTEEPIHGVEVINLEVAMSPCSTGQNDDNVEVFIELNKPASKAKTIYFYLDVQMVYTEGGKCDIPEHRFFQQIIAELPAGKTMAIADCGNGRALYAPDKTLCPLASGQPAYIKLHQTLHSGPLYNINYGIYGNNV
jgi:hypothetical protein